MLDTTDEKKLGRKHRARLVIYNNERLTKGAGVCVWRCFVSPIIIAFGG